LERSSLLTQDNLCPRERGLTTAAAVVNQHTRISILFTWKTSQLERKNNGPKPPKSFSTIIKWGYNKFFSREHWRISSTKIHTDL
jgi:hypothetical protein